MRIFDVNDVEITTPDLHRGYLKKDRIFVKHHEAIDPVEEQWHYEVIAEYPNGGKDIKKVIDVAEVKAQDAWDEYEDIQRYIEYSEDELAQKEMPTFDERITKIEETLLKYDQIFESMQNNVN